MKCYKFILTFFFCLPPDSLPPLARLPLLAPLPDLKVVLAHPDPRLLLLQVGPRPPSADEMPPTEPHRRRMLVRLALELLELGEALALC